MAAQERRNRLTRAGIKLTPRYQILCCSDQMLQAWTCEEVCTALSEGHYNDDDDDVGLSSGTILEVMKGDVKGLPSLEQPVGELEMLVAPE